MVSFHKVINLLKFKSAANLHCFQWKAQSRERVLLQNFIRSRSRNCDHIKINRFNNLNLGGAAAVRLRYGCGYYENTFKYV